MSLARLLAFAGFALAGATALAEYPSRAVTIVVPFSADWLGGIETLGGIPAIRSAAESEKFVGEQFQIYQRLSLHLGMRE